MSWPSAILWFLLGYFANSLGVKLFQITKNSSVEESDDSPAQSITNNPYRNSTEPTSKHDATIYEQGFRSALDIMEKAMDESGKCLAGGVPVANYFISIIRAMRGDT